MQAFAHVEIITMTKLTIPGREASLITSPLFSQTLGGPGITSIRAPASEADPSPIFMITAGSVDLYVALGLPAEVSANIASGNDATARAYVAAGATRGFYGKPNWAADIRAASAAEVLMSASKYAVATTVTLTSSWQKVATVTGGSDKLLILDPTSIATTFDIEWEVVDANASAPVNARGTPIMGGEDFSTRPMPIGDIYAKSATAQTLVVRRTS